MNQMIPRNGRKISDSYKSCDPIFAGLAELMYDEAAFQRAQLLSPNPHRYLCLQGLWGSVPRIGALRASKARALSSRRFDEKDGPLPGDLPFFSLETEVEFVSTALARAVFSRVSGGASAITVGAYCDIELSAQLFAVLIQSRVPAKLVKRTPHALIVSVRTWSDSLQT